MPDTTVSTQELHRAFQSTDMDPKLIHPAIENIRALAGENVVTVLGAQINELRTEIVALRDRIDAQRTEMTATIGALSDRIDAQGAEITATTGALSDRIDAQGAEITATTRALSDRIDAQGAEMTATTRALSDRIDALRDSMDSFRKILWPLVISVSVSLLGLASTLIYQSLQN